MEKRMFKIILITFLIIFIGGNLLHVCIASKKDYHKENEIVQKEIDNKYSRGQGALLKLFYIDDEIDYYFVIEGEAYQVDKEMYDNYNIGDKIDMNVTNEYLGDKLYQSNIKGIKDK